MAHETLTEGYRAAREAPEGSDDHRISFECASECRPCFVAAIAHAVNVPSELAYRTSTGRFDTAASICLEIVRESLDEFDPLRVRAEQALLPLVGAS